MEDVFRDIVRAEVERVADVVRDELRRALNDAAKATRPACGLLTVKQVAARLGVESATVRGYIDEGVLVASKPRKHWLVRPEDLDVFLAKKGGVLSSSEEQLSRILKKVQGL